MNQDSMFCVFRNLLRNQVKPLLAIFVTLALSMEVSAAVVKPVSLSSSGGTVNNSLNLIFDDVWPTEGSIWTGPTNVWWFGGLVVRFELIWILVKSMS